jgi:hypothetical protein
VKLTHLFLRNRGWGILALSNTHFLAVHSEEELLGAALKDLEMVPKLQAGPHPMVNLAKTTRDLPDNPCTQPLIRTPLFRADNPAPGNVEIIAADVGDDEFVFDHMSDDDESDFGEGAEVDDDHDMETNSDDELETEEDLEVDDEEDDDEGDDEDNVDMFYNIINAGGPTAESDIPPTLAAQAEEAVLDAPNVEQEPNQADTSDPEHAEAALVLQGLFTDLFTSSFLSESEEQGTSNFHMHSPAPSTQCLKLQPSNPPTLLDMVYMPHRGQVMEAPRHTLQLARFLKRATEYNENTAGYVTGLGRFAERYHMLRMYEKDIEMRTLDRPRQRGLPELGILCPYALTMGLSPGRAMRPHFRATSRLNMVVHVPELSLVIIGSPIGRVLLVTPTRLVKPIEKLAGVLHHGLRIEWVLPRQSDEQVFRVSKRPLHGMAVGPVQDAGVLGGRDEIQRVAVPRRFRLMLHYRNHDILTYEISREEQTGKLCIF